MISRQYLASICALYPLNAELGFVEHNFPPFIRFPPWRWLYAQPGGASVRQYAQNNGRHNHNRWRYSITIKSLVWNQQQQIQDEFSTLFFNENFNLHDPNVAFIVYTKIFERLGKIVNNENYDLNFFLPYLIEFSFFPLDRIEYDLAGTDQEMLDQQLDLEAAARYRREHHSLPSYQVILERRKEQLHLPFEHQQEALETETFSYTRLENFTVGVNTMRLRPYMRNDRPEITDAIYKRGDQHLSPSQSLLRDDVRFTRAFAHNPLGNRYNLRKRPVAKEKVLTKSRKRNRPALPTKRKRGEGFVKDIKKRARMVGCERYIKNCTFGNQVCISLKVKNNNCLFACLRFAREKHLVTKSKLPTFTGKDMHLLRTRDFEGEETEEIKEGFYVYAQNASNQSEFSWIRSILQLKKDDLVDTANDDNMQKIAMFFKTNIMLWELDDDSNELVPLGIGFEAAGAQVSCDIVIDDGHAYLWDTRNILKSKCDMCGVTYLTRHSCNARKLNFLQKHAKRLGFHELPPNLYMDTNPAAKIMVTEERYEIERDVLFYDIETFPDEKLDHQVYAVGFYFRGEYQAYFGSNAMIDFVKFVLDIDCYTYVHQGSGVQKQYEKEITLPTMIVAWNGARFDHKFFLKTIMLNDDLSSEIAIENLIINNNAILGMSGFRSKDGTALFKVWDPVRFIPSSLDNACKQFGVSEANAKTCFPHRWMRSYDNLEDYLSLEDLNDSKWYFEKDKEKILSQPFNDHDIIRICGETGIMNDDFCIPSRSFHEFCLNKVLPLRSLCEFYLKKDVLGMKEITQKFVDVINTLFNTEIFCFCTISQFSNSQWYEESEHKKKLFTPKDEPEYDFIVKAVYGGRCYPTIRSFQSQDVLKEDLQFDFLKADGDKYTCKKLVYNDIEDYLIEADATSLYPAAMKNFRYPVGQPFWASDPQCAVFRVVDSATDLPLGIFEISFKTNKDLLEPVLPRRGKTGIIWDLRDGEGIYSSVDIDMARRAGYTIIVKRALLWPDSDFVFQAYIEKAYKIKEDGDREGNEVMRAVGKLLLNALFGKMLQKLKSEVSEFVSSWEEALQFVEKNTWENSIVFKPSLMLMSGMKNEISFTKPFHLGVFILSYSRLIMRQHYLNMQEPNAYLERQFLNTHFYTDTDSFWVHARQRLPLKLANTLGALKDECKKHGKVIFAVFLSKKMYAYVYINPKNEVGLHMKCKGIDISQLYLEDFRAAFLDNKSRLTTGVDSLKTFAAQSFENFMNVKSTTLKRTFYKTPFYSRVPINVYTHEVRNFVFLFQKDINVFR